MFCTWLWFLGLLHVAELCLRCVSPSQRFSVSDAAKHIATVKSSLRTSAAELVVWFATVRTGFLSSSPPLHHYRHQLLSLSSFLLLCGSLLNCFPPATEHLVNNMKVIFSPFLNIYIRTDFLSVYQESAFYFDTFLSK